MKKILLTGGTGYIGSHTAVELLNRDYEVVLLDNLSNSKQSVLPRIEHLTGRTPAFYPVDLMDIDALTRVFSEESPDAVIHFAGLKAVGESVADPLRYYDGNVTTSINLCRVMIEQGVRNLVFSSSATVYGEPESVPIRESDSVSLPANPYGHTKIIVERLLADVAHVHSDFNIARLRYFNPAGAHESGDIGEDPNGIPNNLVPFITQVAVGKRKELVIFGDDYDTADGTCIRDYIHVTDLALGHIAALEKFNKTPGLQTYNLGTGTGTSVNEVVAAFERASNQHIPRIYGQRRPGDIPASYTDPGLALAELGWKASRDILDICKDAWRWQQKNPGGYP